MGTIKTNAPSAMSAGLGSRASAAGMRRKGVGTFWIMRSVETSHQKAKTPILFFSGQKCDEGLKRQIERFAPASYVNKGSDPDPEQLIDRIDQLVAHLQTRS